MRERTAAETVACRGVCVGVRVRVLEKGLVGVSVERRRGIDSPGDTTWMITSHISTSRGLRNPRCCVA